jgi:hypothetical protein
MVRQYVKSGKYRKKPPDLTSKLLPMPLAPILLCQPLMVASGGIYRTVVCLALAYWVSGCRDLPDDTSSLATFARMPTGNYVSIKSAVDAILADLLPTLRTEYEARHETRLARKAIAAYATSVSIEARKAKAKPDANHLRGGRIQPVKAPLYRGDARTDMEARQEAIERDATAARQSPATQHNIAPVRHGLLSDGSPSGRVK